jgi:hypothetical protein
MLKINQFLSFGFIFINLVLSAQETIISTGLNSTGNGGTISYSIGQPACDFNSGNNGTISQGVQHPYEIYLDSTVSNDNSNLILDLIAFPNPTTDQLLLSYSDFKNEKLSYQLYNYQGELISIKNCENDKTLIDLKNYPSSTYILSIIKEKKIIKTFRIIKN